MAPKSVEKSGSREFKSRDGKPSRFASKAVNLALGIEVAKLGK